jgi:hypothetical protein
MWQIFGSAVDVVHALLMAAWILGLPLLFVRRWPRLSRVYGVYAIVFIVVSQASEWILGECFLTTIAGSLWNGVSDAAAIDTSEWFTVRLARWVFDMAPSHRSIVIASEVLIFVTAVGVLLTLREGHPRAIKTLRVPLRQRGFSMLFSDLPRRCSAQRSFAVRTPIRDRCLLIEEGGEECFAPAQTMRHTRGPCICSTGPRVSAAHVTMLAAETRARPMQTGSA